MNSLHQLNCSLSARTEVWATFFNSRLLPGDRVEGLHGSRWGAGTRAAVAIATVLTVAAGAVAQEDGAEANAAAGSGEAVEERGAADEELPASFFATTTVTATGTETDAFEVSTPVTTIRPEEIERRLPENAVDMLRAEPGVDVQGVGPNQPRPVIRGQRGLRVLFLENGLRMNNPRRQTDFGEIPGLVSIDSVDTVEVVRGPASVLYGSDAIGGVLNLVTRGPGLGSGGWSGGLGLRYGSAGDSQSGSADVASQSERVSFQLGVSLRDAGDYDAASGSYGDIDLADDVTVIDSGVEDDALYGSLALQAAGNQQLLLRANRYRADQAGFGFVEPELLGEEDDFRIRILYPFQDFDRYTLSYLGVFNDSPVADTLEVQGYYQNNERQLVNDIDINIGPLFFGAPDSSVEADTENFTDLETLGLRLEATRNLRDRDLLTYGFEAYEDDSFNTDFSTTTTTLRFPFPPFETPIVTTDDIANAPNATNTSLGAFAQVELNPVEDWTLSVGARYQDVETRAEETPGLETAGLDFSDDSLVGAISAVYRVSDSLNLVGSYGTAFRAPGIVERLFNGVTPEGAGFQLLNPDLVSEESENYELGLKYRRANVIFELNFFRNDIDDGIIQKFLTDEEIAQLPQDLQDQIDALRVDFVVQQVNADRLRYEGVEAIIGYRFANGIVLGGNYTHIDGERLDSTNPPTGDTFADKINAYVRYEAPRGRYWTEYRLRHNGDDRANLDPGEPVPPVGEILPSFTVHTLAAGVTLFDRGSQSHDLNVVVDNLTDELYAEFSNATFFRPQPGRNVKVAYRLRLN